MDGSERKKDRKRESILRAAMDLFKLYGFKKTSVSDIARRADVSQVTIYNHFGSKDGLVREVVKAQLSGILERARGIMAGEEPFPDKLEAIVFDKAQTASQYHGELMQAAAQNDPEMREFIESFWRTDVTRATADVIDAGKREGYINPQLSAETAMLYLEILRRGIFASSDLLEDLPPDADLYRELNYLFIYGLIGRRG